MMENISIQVIKCSSNLYLIYIKGTGSIDNIGDGDGKYYCIYIIMLYN